MIIGLVGFIGSGKNTVAQCFQKKDFKFDSFAAPLKDSVSSVFGWPRNMLEGDTDQSRAFRETPDTWWSQKLGIKNFTPRFALQYLGTEIYRDSFNDNIWLHSLESRYIGSGRRRTVVSDCRFKNEIGLIKTMGGKVVRVSRGEKPHWYNLAEQAAQGDQFSMHTLNDMGIHRSEWDWVSSRVDFEIKNDKDIAHLEKEVDNIIKQLS
jgi:hypothetical protein